MVEAADNFLLCNYLRKHDCGHARAHARIRASVYIQYRAIASLSLLFHYGRAFHMCKNRNAYL